MKGLHRQLLTVSEIKGLHIEASSYCNARCPQCPRNFNGWNNPEDLMGNAIQMYKHINQHLSVEQLSSIVEQIPHSVNAHFNGNHGDPMMNPNIAKLCALFKSSMITTNGSCGRVETYCELAKTQTQITFSIDGLEDTNHIYRQDVDWKKIMERATAFIDNGGIAHWKYVIFDHNKHQIRSADVLSQQMGFASFTVVNDNRNYGPILDNTGQQVGWLLPHNSNQQPQEFDVDMELLKVKNTYTNLQTTADHVTIDCEIKKDKTIYIDVTGSVLPCCYHGVAQHIHPKGTTLQQQLDSYLWLEDTWKKDCDETCYSACKR